MSNKTITMKDKKNHTIVTILASQKEVGLTVGERTEMFSQLQAFATLHSPQSEPAVLETRRSAIFLLSRWSVAVASVFFLTVGTGFASTQSLPGDSLYGIKVSVVEPLISLTNSNDTEQLEYQISLMERRLNEMETLYRTNALTEVEADILEEQITVQASNFEDLVSSVEHSEISAEASLTAVSQVVVAIKKQSVLVEKEFGSGRQSTLGGAEETLDQLYEVELNNFIATEPEAVTEYVEELLIEVDRQIVADPDIAISSALELDRYLEDIEETLETGDLKQAVESAGEASHLLETGSFFDTLGGSIE
jgi:hypothetical protein